MAYHRPECHTASFFKFSLPNFTLFDPIFELFWSLSRFSFSGAPAFSELGISVMEHQHLQEYGAYTVGKESAQPHQQAFVYHLAPRAFARCTPLPSSREVRVWWAVRGLKAIKQWTDGSFGG